MTFGKIISAAGFCPCNFPRSSNTHITLYDGKNRVLTEAKYAKELFADNIKSAVSFFNFLCFFESKPATSMNIKIDENFVTVFYKTEQAWAFKRTPSMEPLDYMD